MSQIPVIDIPTAKTFIKLLAVRKHRPLMFWGPAGVGKSQMVGQVTAELDATLVDIRLSQYDSVDLRGFPGVQPGTDHTVWYAPSTLPFKGNPAFDEDRGIIVLFLDEINGARPETAAVAYQLVNDRSVGEHRLMDNVVIIAAGNRDMDRGVTNRQPAPLSNRFQHFEITASIAAFTAHAADKGFSPLGIGFLNYMPDRLHTFRPESPEKAFASPRTWEFAFNDYEDPELPQDLRFTAVAGCVGQGAAADFFAFAKVYQSLASIDDIIAKPDTMPVPDELDARYATAVSISGNMSAENVDALQTYMERMPQEFMVLAWTLALRRDEDLTDTNAFLTRYAPVIVSTFSGT